MSKRIQDKSKGKSGKESKGEEVSEHEKQAIEREKQEVQFKEYKDKTESRCFNYMQTLKLSNFHYENYKDFILKWLENQNLLVENYILSGKCIKDVPEETKQLVSCQVMNTCLPWRAHRHFISRLEQLKVDPIKNILWKIESICNGNFNNSIRLKLVFNQSLFMTEFLVYRNFTDQFDLLYMVGIEQSPITNKNEDAINKFQYRQYVMFLNLVFKNENIDTNYIKMKYEDLLNDPCRTNFRRDPQQKTLLGYNYNQVKYFFNEIETDLKGYKQKMYKSNLPEEQKTKDSNFIDNSKDKEQEKLDHHYNFNTFEDHFLSYEESQNYEYIPESYRWVLKEKKIVEEKHKEKEERALQNKQILSTFADFSSASNLVELLQKIPNLNLKLTQEEIDVIGQHGNVMVIGRSGTGKTTCAMLRLFAMEVLFHIRIQIYISKNAKVLQDALTNQQIGMQSVFITASPVLANQIKKYYNKLTSQVKDEIRRKQQLKKQQSPDNEQETNQEIINSDTIEEAKSLIETFNDTSADQSSVEDKIIQDELSNLSYLQNKNVEDEQKDGEKKQDENDDDVFEDDDMNDRFTYAEQGSKYTSLKDMVSSDFPAFLTVRSYLLLIEGCLHDPFFLKDQEGKLTHQEGHSSWGNYRSEKQKQQLTISDDSATQKQKEEDFYEYDESNLEEIYQREQYLKIHQNTNGKILDIEKQTPSDRKFEVDYNYFANAFWPIAAVKFKESNIISCSTLWTEIYSYIKGSSSSFSYSERFMTKEDYLKLQLNVLLSPEQKDIIYRMFEYYEIWKLQQSGYDLMDLVNYLLKEVQKKKCDVPSIHFTMIDEVQDLPYAIITLFSMINEQNLFLAGDSAQTIARGVGFRFGDLKQVFSNFSHYFDKNLEEPHIRQLTVNFRSHNKILQLSNSIISLIEGLFPSTIDVLKKERSNIDGLKPIVLADSNLGFLFTLLQGQQSEQGQIPLEFGCNQVIIVKDEESKKKLPQILQHAICLTIYEAKGLEFDDVILFNFFADSNCTKNQWESVNLLNISKEKHSKETFLKMMTMHDSVFKEEIIKHPNDPSFANAYGVEYNQSTDEVTVNQVVTKSQVLRTYDRINNALLCSELKQLYTAVTRPKNRLIIFDTRIDNRNSIINYWNKQNLVSLISSEETEEQEQKEQTTQKNDQPKVLDIRAEEERQNIIKSVQKLLVKNTSQEWFEQGIKMFKFKYFEQAVKCFKKSGHFEHEKKAQAYFEASENSAEIVKIENQLSLLKQGIGQYAIINQNGKKLAKNNLNKQLNKLKNNFVVIGDKFLEINKRKQAAQCYFSGGEFEKAGKLYVEINQIREAAESYFLLGDQFQKAALLYEKIKDFPKAIQCYEHIQEWIQILNLIQRNSSRFNTNEIQKLTDKYITQEFQSITQTLENQNKSTKDPQEQINETIQEDQSDEQFSSFDSDLIEDEEQSNDDEEEESITSQALKDTTFNDTAYEEIEEEQKDNQKSHVSKKLNQNKNSSAVKSSDNSYSIVENKRPNESGISDMSFDHLSHIDPSDEWLKVDNGSIFEKLNQSTISQSIVISEFSILDNSFIDDEQANFQIIKTKMNTSISDEILKRVLNLLAITDSKINQQILKLINDDHEEEIVLVKEEKELTGQTELEKLNLDKLSPELIESIITVLQQFHQSKISLLICNRYKVYSRIGQIVVSLALKYSPFSKTNAQVLQTHFNSQLNFLVKKQKELSFVSNTALHSIFESINPDLMSISSLFTSDSQQIPNLFTTDCIQALLLLGYWKRILFLINKKTSLEIAQTFGDFNSYKALALQSSQNIHDSKNIPKFNHLTDQHANGDDQKLAIISLEHYIYYFIDKKFKSLNSQKQLELPSFYKYNYFIWKNLNKKQQKSEEKADNETLRQLLTDAQQIFDQLSKESSEITIFDTVTAFCMILLYDAQFQLLDEKLSIEVQPLLAKSTNSLIKFLESYTIKYNQQSFQIISAIFTIFQIRTIPNSEILSVFGRNKVIIHKSSQFASEIFKNSKLIADEGNIYYCDIDFEHVIAPFNASIKRVAQQIKTVVNGILNKLSLSQQKEDEDYDQKRKKLVSKNIDLTNDQRMKYKISQIYHQRVTNNVTEIEKLFNQNQMLLQYGQTEKYNRQIFDQYKQQENAIFYEMMDQILVNLAINYNPNEKITLYIPKNSLHFYYGLEEKQLLLKDSQKVQSFKKQNPDVLLLNLNDYENFEDIDEICQYILNIAEDITKRPQYFEDQGIINPENILFTFIITIFANINDAEKESIEDLVGALKILNLRKGQTIFLENNQSYRKILKSSNIDDIREATLDLIEDEEFDQYFDTFKTISIYNEATPAQNNKVFKDEPTLVKAQINLRLKSAKIIYSYLIKNKFIIKSLKQIRKTMNLYFDFFEIHPYAQNEEYLKLFKRHLVINDAHTYFDLLRNTQKELFKLFYECNAINDEAMKIITDQLKQRNNLFIQFSNAFNNLIQNNLSKQSNKIQDNKNLGIVKVLISSQSNDILRQIQSIIRSNAQPKPKKIIEIAQKKQSAQNQKVLQLLKKRANIIKQQQILEQKSLGFRK